MVVQRDSPGIVIVFQWDSPGVAIGTVLGLVVFLVTNVGLRSSGM